MAAMGVLSVSQQKKPWNFIHVLASAILEWLLILMLFIDAGFSFLITKCARHWKLHTPCLLCSRLEHILSTENKGFYRDLICHDHKSEISSLVLCHVHDKLVDVYGSCENCLFSFATIDKSNSQTYSLLIGKVGNDLTYSGSINPLLGHQKISFSCPCCNEPCVSRCYTQKLSQIKPIGLDTEERRDKPSVSAGSTGQRNVTVDNLSYIGYSEVKISSDTESEVLFSDNDTPIQSPLHSVGSKASSLKNNGTNESRDEPSMLTRATDDPSSSEVDYLSYIGYTEVKLNSDTESEAILSDNEVILPVIKTNNHENYLSAQSDLIEPLINSPGPDHGLLSAKAVDHVSPSPLELQAQSDDVQFHENIPVVHELEELNWGPEESKRDPLPETDLITLHDDEASWSSNLVESNVVDPGDAYNKIAVHDKARHSSRTSEDHLNLLTRGTKQAMNQTMTPRNSGETTTTDMLFPKKIFLERNESNLSLDGSLVSELEGESAIERLKRQVEHDRKLLSSLYKELEEERNASAIATNQAMAMITKLQEEKAAIHMEAMQYLRMMEEQAEYDNEALEKTSDMLAEKEKEVQNLEAELEFHKKKYPKEELMLENVDFDNERVDIVQGLKKLEKMLYLFSNNGDCSDHELGVTEENEVESSLNLKTEVNSEADLPSIESEMFGLKERLERLEADRDFLEHSINSLRNEEEGLQLVREIACSLRELRKIRIRRDSSGDHA